MLAVDGASCGWGASNKYVQTAGYVAEQKAGKALFKGAFSTGNPSGGWFNNPFDLKFKNVANTHVTQVRRKAWGACPVSK